MTDPSFNKPTRAFLLKETPFGEKDHISRLFTEEFGVISCFCQGKQKKVTALTLVELRLHKGRGELFYIQEVSSLNHFFSLRDDLKKLQAAAHIIHHIEKTQHPFSPSKKLFLGVVNFIEALQDAEDPETLLASFQLKLLRLESFLDHITHCVECQTPLNDCSIDHEGSKCIAHTSSQHKFSQEERELMFFLLNTPVANRLKTTTIPHFVCKKINELFVFLSQNG